MEVRQHHERSAPLVMSICYDIAEPMRELRVQGCVGSHNQSFIKIKDVKVVVEDLVLFVLVVVEVLEQIVPYLYHVVVVVYVTINEGVHPGEHATDQWLVLDACLELHLVCLKVEDVEGVHVILIPIGICALKNHYDLVPSLVHIDRFDDFSARCAIFHHIIDAKCAVTDINPLDNLSLKPALIASMIVRPFVNEEEKCTVVESVKILGRYGLNEVDLASRLQVTLIKLNPHVEFVFEE